MLICWQKHGISSKNHNCFRGLVEVVNENSLRNILGGRRREVAAARRNTKTAAVTNRACGALEASCVRVRREASPRRRVHILLHPVGFRHVPQTRKRANARHEKFVNTQQLSGHGWVFEGGG